MQNTGISANGKTCCIRKATADDTDQLARLIHTSSIHADSLRRQHKAKPAPQDQSAQKNARLRIKNILFRLVASQVKWRDYCVAVSPEGSVIGCCQVKTHRCGTREVDTLCLDKNWRNGTIAAELMRFVVANNPHPLWGTCLDNVVAFQKRNGGSLVTDPARMPAVLRRRWRLFNFFLHLAGKKSHLNVMMIDNSPPDNKPGTGTSKRVRGLEATRNDLVKHIKKYQLKKSRPFRFPGLYESIRGLFVSYPTYTSSLLQKYCRKTFLFRVPDNNAFVTFWTLELLLEAFEYDSEGLADIRIRDAVSALMEFHDRTRDQDDPLFVFWKQRTINGHPVVFPSNLMPFYRLFRLFEFLLNTPLKTVAKIRPAKGRSNAHPGHAPRRSAAAFSLPADFDDAALNWSLGSCLSKRAATYPDAWSTWSGRHFDFGKLARHALACAYRPFGDDRDAGAIDPRSFYAIRSFLWDLQDSGRDCRNFSLLTTWASTLHDNIEGIQRYYKMPFNVNNLDCSAQANFIHAACRAQQSGMFPQDVENFENLILDTAEYLAWAVASGTILKYPDITLLYYPTPACAFFFISRIVQLLENLRGQVDSEAICSRVETILTPAARQHITDYLLASAVQSGSTAYWQRPSGGHSASPGNALDDRKFMTAVSLTCLLNLWTQQHGSALVWVPTVPAPVPVLTVKAMAWLRQHNLSPPCCDHNAFFSASVKHRRSLPFMFPANMLQHSDGPALQSGILKQKKTRHSVYAMSGVPSREDYARMLKEKGLDTVEEDAFQKSFDLDYPYWSAPTVTSALVLLALSKAEKMGL